MKKKTLYLLALIFSVSLFSAAKKVKSNCDTSVSCQLMKSGPANEAEMDFPSLGLFLFNN
ncbi:MAG TPA: hypothetical protein VFZ33_02180 [Chitinophagaceae bacterium]